MKAVKITWTDSCASNFDWILKSDIDNWKNIEPITIFTYGVIVQEDDYQVVVAQNYGTNPEQCCSLMSIPRGCIMKIEDLEELKEDNK